MLNTRQTRPAWRRRGGYRAGEPVCLLRNINPFPVQVAGRTLAPGQSVFLTAYDARKRRQGIPE